MIFILGINSFIAKHLYLTLRKLPQCQNQVRCLSHGSYPEVTDDDIIINCCGVNTGDSYEIFNQANNLFVQELVERFGPSRPHLIHISSLMANGFKDQSIEDLPERQQFFIRSKLAGETYLINNYPGEKLCIVRPSNIYGYSCRPYYNNVLVTMACEKLSGEYKITSLNQNCLRNFLSVEGLSEWLANIIVSKLEGSADFSGSVFAIMSNNTVSLDKLALLLHRDKVPESFLFEDGPASVPNVDIPSVTNVVIEEDLEAKIAQLVEQITCYQNLNSAPSRLARLSQHNGEMVEISGLNSSRLYMISINEGCVRGNHYHYEQVEHFYQYKGKVIFLIAHKDFPDVVMMHIIQEGEFLEVVPYQIHTLTNDLLNNPCEVLVLSTQCYIPNSSPDTCYQRII